VRFQTSTTKLLITRPPKLCPINIIGLPQSSHWLHKYMQTIMLVIPSYNFN
jgi:hypothetical protein